MHVTKVSNTHFKKNDYIEAELIMDSVNSADVRISTFRLKMPMSLLREFNTHRVFSRNAASSRAIPAEKMIKWLETTYYSPVFWGCNQKGMQAQNECNNAVSIPEFFDVALDKEVAWERAKIVATKFAKGFSDADYHKQIVNVLLDPFTIVDVLVTSTEWDNFYELRNNSQAKPEIHYLAYCMKRAHNNSTPKKRALHAPFVHPDLANESSIRQLYGAVASAARISYYNHGKSKLDSEKDKSLTNMLKSEGHMSPFEHVAFDYDEAQDLLSELFQDFVPDFTRAFNFKSLVDDTLWSNNFRGWSQLRKLINEFTLKEG